MSRNSRGRVGVAEDLTRVGGLGDRATSRKLERGVASEGLVTDDGASVVLEGRRIAKAQAWSSANVLVDVGNAVKPTVLANLHQQALA